MSVAMADLHTALISEWNKSTLNATFRGFWVSTEPASIELPAEYPVITDQEGVAGQPFPYCVLQPSVSATQSRMSGSTGGFVQEIRDISITLHIHAKSVAGDSRTPKQIAAFLAEEVMKVFGGHPTSTPVDLQLSNGEFLLSQYQQDFGTWTGEDEFQWVIEYMFRIDVPVAVVAV